MFREAMKGKGNQHTRKDDNINPANQGTSKAYTLSRLQKDNPTEEQAKKASKAEKIRKLADEKPEMSRAEIAREVGSDRSLVSHVLKKPRNAKSSTPNIIIRLTLDPTRTAANIHAKMGAEPIS
jgi:hydroxylamine reductase (hybrid-cluster protein)